MVIGKLKHMDFGISLMSRLSIEAGNGDVR